jgi:hypothetical protein
MLKYLAAFAGAAVLATPTLAGIEAFPGKFRTQMVQSNGTSLFVRVGGQGPAKAYDIAELYAWRGEKDKAFEWLDRAYQQHSSDLCGFRHNKMFASLRGDARFAALLRKMNLPVRDDVAD